MEAARRTTLAALVAAVALLLVTPAQGIDCVQCTSDDSLDCVSSPPAATRCPPQSKYCITVQETIIEDNSLSLLTRTCSILDLGDKCEDTVNPNKDDVSLCRSVCNEDGCNDEPVQLNSGAGFFGARWLLVAAPTLLLATIGLVA